MPKVSVVIPCYNVEKYIRQCIDSLIAQTLENIEIICVDDGSSDGTLAILREYARNDVRIKVLQQENQYAGVARNNGLSVATGEYVIFLDGDDFFEPRMLELTCAAADEKQVDIVLFGFKRFDDKAGAVTSGDELPRLEFVPQADVFSAKDVPNDIFRITTPAPWTKLYRRSFVAETGLQFQALSNSNDAYFVQSSLALAKRICTVQEVLVYYRVNMPCSTQGAKDKDPLCFLAAINKLYTSLQEWGMYPLLKGAFQHSALSAVNYNLTTLKLIQSRRAVLEVLDSEDFKKYDLLGHDQNFYACQMSYAYATSISNALAQYRITKAAENVVVPETVIPYRGNQEICVSVIIPVFNTADYLEETLRSICNQTLKSIEIICIDDGSTDNSQNILREWAQRDCRISVLVQPNSGQSCARNAGVRIAQGRYVYFMDSDDILDERTLETLFDKADKENLDAVYFDAVSFFEDPSLEQEHEKFANKYRRSQAYSEVYAGQDLFWLLCSRGEFLVSPCLQMLRRAYIIEKGISFRPSVIHEDWAFTFSAILQAERVSHINVPFFHRRMRHNSTMTNAVSFKNAYGYFMAYQDMLAVYYKLEQNLSDPVKTEALGCIGQKLLNAQAAYCQLSPEEQKAALGLNTDYIYFERIVGRQATTRMKMEEFRTKMNQAYAEKSEINAKLKKTYAEKSEINAKLKKTYAEKSEINAKLKAAYAEKTERGIKVQELEKENEYLKEKLKGTYSLGKRIKRCGKRIRNKMAAFLEKVHKHTK